MSYHPWIPNDNEYDRDRILSYLGIKKAEELFSHIPPNLRLKRKLKIGASEPLDMVSIENKINEILAKNKVFPLNKIFAGGPIAPHYVHPVTRYLISRGEFLTAYTPYQPEISQGVLKALFEYQSLMAELYGVDIVNAGMYDGATALAEAALMAIRIKKEKKVLIPDTLFDEYKSVMSTYLYGSGSKIIEYSFDEETGEISPNSLELIRKEKASAVIIDYPSNLGPIRMSTKDVIETAHEVGSLSIVFSDPSSLPIILPPGELGADIVAGEGQSLGLPMSGGGSTLGILGIRHERELLRNLPGRLIGETTDVNGNKGYLMILQTREQHIRREKATSNITTAASLNAIAVTINSVVLGESGLRTKARKIFENTMKMKGLIEKLGLEVLYSKAMSFKNIAYKLNNPEKVERFMIYDRGILPFYAQKRFVISASTEVHKFKDIEDFVSFLKEVV